MTKAEEAALAAYPCPPTLAGIRKAKEKRIIFIQGYEQAKKDLALTWEDAVTMVTVAMDIIGEGKITGEQNIYTEVLRRFNSQREKK